jgi:DNA-directed RNA polymerase subunit RPC12/RpoP
MALEKAHKTCSSCETKYTVTWDIEEQDLEPLTCPFCGYEVDNEEEESELWTNNDDSIEDDNWN